MTQEAPETQTGGRSPRRPGFLRRALALLRLAGGEPTVPSSIGRYRVLRVIGEGGMGTVFEAQDEVLGRRVAIKRLKGVADASARRRFWREARAVARLSHPNVCPLYEVGEDASGPFLAMELLSGESVAARLRQGPMGAAEAVSLGTGVSFGCWSDISNWTPPISLVGTMARCNCIAPTDACHSWRTTWPGRSAGLKVVSTPANTIPVTSNPASICTRRWRRCTSCVALEAVKRRA